MKKMYQIWAWNQKTQDFTDPIGDLRETKEQAELDAPMLTDRATLVGEIEFDEVKTGIEL